MCEPFEKREIDTRTCDARRAAVRFRQRRQRRRIERGIDTTLHNDIYHVKLPSTSSFPMEKYRFVREALQEAVSKLAMFYESPLASLRDLTTVHTEEYVRRFLSNELSRDENRRIGFPWTEQSGDRALSSPEAPLRQPCRLPRRPQRLRSTLWRPYCWRRIVPLQIAAKVIAFNDIAVAAGVALRDYLERLGRSWWWTSTSTREWVRASLRTTSGWSRTHSTVSATCSRRARPPISTSTLPDGAGDDDYLLLSRHLPPVFASTKPDLVFFQAGVDPHLDDRIGRLQLTTAGLKKRNAIVYELAAKHACRLVLTMGGGYPRDLDPSSAPFHRVIQAHMDCYRMCMTAHAKLMRSAE